MKYDLAIWEPAESTDAAETFRALVERYMEGASDEEPTARIEAFLSSLTAVFPEGALEEGVWASEPLRAGAKGPFLYLCIVGSHLEEVGPVVVRLAAEHGLVCFDPQVSARYS
ncbi:hypothetical protein [Sandaracinus amylolyticus]|uniref:hypothetical protein n=1 Tax=Sandaracinus amylolyticus TaxID=927083 RepID=UPI001F2E82BE|nr:hypothetical protein [Sandaracinus amylolyticus]UJR82941.1 Hypothetical protein I5071_50060 [Sandaracinus amylolyticus]